MKVLVLTWPADLTVTHLCHSLVTKMSSYTIQPHCSVQRDTHYCCLYLLLINLQQRVTHCYLPKKGQVLFPKCPSRQMYLFSDGCNGQVKVYLTLTFFHLYKSQSNSLWQYERAWNAEFFQHVKVLISWMWFCVIHTSTLSRFNLTVGESEREWIHLHHLPILPLELSSSCKKLLTHGKYF